MAEWIIILKNNSGADVPIDDLGLVIYNGTSINAHLQFDYGELAGSEDLRAAVSSGTIVVNNGSVDLSSSDGTNFLIRENKLDVDKAQSDASQAISDAAAAQATADGAVTAANNAQSAADAAQADATQALSDAAAAQSAANAAQADATQALSDAAAAQSAADAAQATADSKVSKAGDTMTGDLNMGANEVFSTADPSGPNALTRRAWVEAQINAAAAGLDPKASCEAAQAKGVALPSYTYDNGTSGVGATITANANGALPSIDGVTLAVGQRVLIWQEPNPAYNGIYVVNQLGDASSPFILTRSEDMDGNPAAEIDGGEHTLINRGTSNKGNQFTTVDITTPFTVGTDPMTWDYFSTSQDLSAIQSEIDAIEQSLGSMVDNNGNFVPPTGTNFLDAVASISAALLALDAAAQQGIDDAAAAQSAADAAQATADANALKLADLKVVNGEIFGKDSTRNRWLGSLLNFVFSRKGGTKNQYLKMAGDTYSNTSGIRIPKATVLTSLSVQLKDVGTCTVEIRKNDQTSAIASLDCTGAQGAQATNLNVALAAGDYIQCYVSCTNKVKDPAVVAIVANDGGAVT